MKLGSPQAAQAYENWLLRQADDYWIVGPYCPWCGASGQQEEGECTKCDRPLTEGEYFECPYCGERRAEAFAHCGESSAHNVRYHLTDGCTKCHSCDISEYHHEGNLAAPECTYKVCETCGHQWGHS